MRPVDRLLLLVLLVTAGNAAEPVTLTFQRATVDKATYEAEQALYAQPLLHTERVFQALMDKQLFTVETLGTATLADGMFTVDTTREVHFFAPTAIGTYTLETAERKVGFRCTGRLSGEQAPYSLSYDLYFSHLKRRLPIGFDKNLAPDLDAGLPEMHSVAMRSGRTLVQDVPQHLGSAPGQNPATVSFFFVVLH